LGALACAAPAFADNVRQCSPSERAVAADRKPIDVRPVVQPLPVYPRIMHPPPHVIVRLFVAVRKSGTVRDVCVVETRPPEPMFEKAAVDSILQWRYAPAVVAKLPRDRRMVIDFEFVLSDR